MTAPDRIALRWELGAAVTSGPLMDHPDYTQYVRADLVRPTPLAEALAVPTDAARDVLAERARQVSAEGWTPEHDDEHDSGELARAAATYAMIASAGVVDRGDNVPTTWPWDRAWWKPSTSRRDLVKAGALILAEIERLDRAAARADLIIALQGTADDRA